MATSEQMRGNQNAAGKRRVQQPRQAVSISGNRLERVTASLRRHGEQDVTEAVWRLLDQALLQEEHEFSPVSQHS